MTIEEKLGDGSTLTVVDDGFRSSTVSREVDGVCVWGQCFSHGPGEEWPGVRVLEVVESMRDLPQSFDRRGLWDIGTGAAVRP